MIEHKKNLQNILSALAMVIMLIGCSSDNRKIVAEIGEEPITLDEFKIGYMNIIKKPDVFDSKALREQFLDEIISIKLLSDEAYKMKLDTSERYKFRFEAYMNKALREEHFNSVIKPEIEITDDDVEQAYRFTQEERRISHLFFRTKEAADSAYKLLQSGTSFNDLAKQIYAEPTLRESGGDLGWINWDQLDYNMAQAAFTLPVNKFSEPVKSSYGYHIVKVTDFKKKPLITRAEYEQHKRKTHYMLEYKIGDKLALDYIRKAASDSEVDIKEEAYWFVFDKLQNKLSRKPTQFDQMFDLQLKEEEVRLLESTLWDERSRTIVTVNGTDYNIGQLVAALNYVPYEQLYNNFKGALDIVIRDFILTQEAKSMGLQSKPDVQQKTKMFEEYILQLAFRRELVRNVKVNDSEVTEYYENNKARFKAASYESVYPVIKKTLLGQKKRSVIPEYVYSLSTGLKIKKYPNVINSYYDAIIRKEKGFNDQ